MALAGTLVAGLERGAPSSGSRARLALGGIRRRRVRLWRRGLHYARAAGPGGGPRLARARRSDHGCGVARSVGVLARRDGLRSFPRGARVCRPLWARHARLAAAAADSAYGLAFLE